MKYAITLFFVLNILLVRVTLAAELITLPTRPGVTQKLLLIKPEHPIASVILFTGGNGVIGLGGTTNVPTLEKGKNFLVRSRAKFVEQGLMVAVVDSPSDQKWGMDGGFRNSANHVKDMEAVIAYLRHQSTAPIWLVGTSMGTISAAYVAIHTHEKIDGLVLTSTITERSNKGLAVTQMDLDQITVPTLIISHEQDACGITPPAAAKTLAAQFTKAPKIEVNFFSGGNKPKSGPCEALSYHGFFGIEDQVVTTIANWIKATQKP